jgi:hypothetical protein
MERAGANAGLFRFALRQLMSEKKEVKSLQVVRPGKTSVLNDCNKSAHTQKSFTTSHNKDKIGKPKPGGG